MQALEAKGLEMFLPEEAGALGAVAEGTQEVNRYAEIESVGEDKPVEAAKPESDKPAKPEGENGPEDDAEAKRKKGGFTKKLAAKDAEIAELRAKLSGEPKPEKAAEPAAKPKPESFETWDAYYEALADWKVGEGVTKLVAEKLKERDTQAQQDRLRDEHKTLQAQYKAKADEFKAQQPDFDEVVDEYDGPLTPLMQQALLESEVGPQLAYYVAKNPAEGARLAQLGAIGLAKAIGRIEATLDVEEPVKAAPKVTNAPPPIKPVVRAAASKVIDPYSGETAPEDYKAWRAKQKR